MENRTPTNIALHKEVNFFKSRIQSATDHLQQKAHVKF